MELKPPDWQWWALLAPSLLALYGLFRYGLVREAPPPPLALWTAGEILATIALAVLAFVSVVPVFHLLDVPPLTTSAAAGVAAIASFGLLAGAVLFSVIASGRPGGVVGLEFPRRARNLLAVALALPVFLAPIEALNWGWKWTLVSLGASPQLQIPAARYMEAIERGDAWGIAFLAAGALVAAPVAEELFFRGFLSSVLRERVGMMSEMVVASAAFAAIHGEPSVLVPIFAVGLALHWIFRATGSLAYSILFHALFNLNSLASLHGVWDG